MTKLDTTEQPAASPASDWLAQPLSLAVQIDWEKALYITFLVAGLITRFWGLGDRVVSHDESLHTQYAYQYYNGDGYSHTPLMHGPFLFHITAFSYWLFGHDDFTARIPVAIFGLILIALPYFLRGWLGRWGALAASFIFLISPYVTYYSRYIRHDVYVIVWALIIFIATWHYLRDGGMARLGLAAEKSLWWFSFGLALMFATKEVAFIYVAIFGSFLIYRLVAQLAIQPWVKQNWPPLRVPLAIVGLGILLLGVGVMGKVGLESRASAAVLPVEAEPNQPIAADPNAALSTPEETQMVAGVMAMRWLQIAGIITVSMGLFLIGNAWRSRLEQFPEFDLIVLYVTLILPLMAPLLVVIAGWDPLDYSINSGCFWQGPDGVPTTLPQLFNGACWPPFIASGLVRTSLFAAPLILVSLALGLWWRGRTWLICAAIFHICFALLYTSIFTNPSGWTSGTIGSLGYWLEQQEVQRGSQPWFYYAIVVPLYEFLPLLFTLAAVRLWAIKERFHAVTSYWLWGLVVGGLTFSYVNWLYNRLYALTAENETIIPGLVVTIIWLGLALFGWVAVRWPQLKGQSLPTLRHLIEHEGITGFVPSLVWWLVLTIVAYSYAGEKMPWLSIHFVIPMAFLVGWYVNERWHELRHAQLFTRRQLWLTGLTALLLIALFAALEPWLSGRLDFASQQAQALNLRGRFIGSWLVVLAVGYALVTLIGRDESAAPLVQVRQVLQNPAGQHAWRISLFILLSLLTVRFTYMANFPNADYTTEYLVYAHGAPATKAEILPQLEQLSMRLYGDKSIQVVYDNESSWPYTWYLRDYPNRWYVGENPPPNVTEAPVMIIGNQNWGKVEPYLRDEYDYQTYTYLWWPMEEYRQLSWLALVGDPALPTQRELDGSLARGETPVQGQARRGLGNADVRQAVWDILFYRDYNKYGEVFGKNYRFGEWPLRDEVRLYIRKDVRGRLWDYGVGATAIVEPVNPYAEREFLLEPTQVFGQGELNQPRNAAVGPDGRLYVADSGNHRIAIFEAGQEMKTFGEQGEGEGQFNEPWSVAVDDSFIYVADTWNHRLQKFTLDGEFVQAVGRSGTIDQARVNNDGGLFYGPRDIILLGDDQLAVTDTGNHRVQIFDRDGGFVQAFGGLGALSGQFFEPVGLATSPHGNLYVVDTWNGRIQELVPGAGYAPIFEWMVEAWDGQSINNKPYLVTDAQGRLYVTDPEGYRVLIFGPDGTYLGRFGQYRTDSSGFGLPNGLAIDADNNLYVVDAVNGQVLQFVPIFQSSAPAEVIPNGEEGAEEDAESVIGGERE